MAIALPLIPDVCLPSHDYHRTFFCHLYDFWVERVVMSDQSAKIENPGVLRLYGRDLEPFIR